MNDDVEFIGTLHTSSPITFEGVREGDCSLYGFVVSCKHNRNFSCRSNCCELSLASRVIGHGEGQRVIKGDEPEPTAVENVQTNQVQGTKILRDGMLLIERNGKLYNATGAEIK